ncbi:type II toxin-antitoxin system MqsA family antitoxin [Anaerovibrio sp.]|uniref:type II toxin-antitoxin system MqsA family antitoxin n=1 Tax=Anaerovibrio sp. TaxID=1872532 RepID=UPI003F147B0B
MFCHCQETKYSTTTHVVTLDDCVIVVKNVPCLECVQCGENFFTDDVMEQLDKIIIQARQALSEVIITDYSKMKVA